MAQKLVSARSLISMIDRLEEKGKFLNTNEYLNVLLNTLAAILSTEREIITYADFRSLTDISPCPSRSHVRACMPSGSRVTGTINTIMNRSINRVAFMFANLYSKYPVRTLSCCGDDIQLLSDPRDWIGMSLASRSIVASGRVVKKEKQLIGGDLFLKMYADVDQKSITISASNVIGKMFTGNLFARSFVPRDVSMVSSTIDNIMPTLLRLGSKPTICFFYYLQVGQMVATKERQITSVEYVDEKGRPQSIKYMERQYAQTHLIDLPNVYSPIMVHALGPVAERMLKPMENVKCSHQSMSEVHKLTRILQRESSDNMFQYMAEKEARDVCRINPTLEEKFSDLVSKRKDAMISETVESLYFNHYRDGYQTALTTQLESKHLLSSPSAHFHIGMENCLRAIESPVLDMAIRHLFPKDFSELRPAISGDPTLPLFILYLREKNMDQYAYLVASKDLSVIKSHPTLLEAYNIMEDEAKKLRLVTREVPYSFLGLPNNIKMKAITNFNRFSQNTPNVPCFSVNAQLIQQININSFCAQQSSVLLGSPKV